MYLESDHKYESINVIGDLEITLSPRGNVSDQKRVVGNTNDIHQENDVHPESYILSSASNRSPIKPQGS